MAADTRQMARALAELGAGGALRLAGPVPPARAWLCAELVHAGAGPLLWMVPGEAAAEQAEREARFFLGGESGAPGDPFARRIERLPLHQASFYDELSPDRELCAERMAVLFRLAEKSPPDLLIASAESLARLGPPAEMPDREGRLVLLHQRLDLAEWATHLQRVGYLRVPLVEEPGSFSVRGGIMDVFTPLMPFPLRLELLGDEVDSIRLFHPETQLTRQKLDSAYVCPVREIIWDEESREGARRRLEELSAGRDLPAGKVLPLLRALRDGDFLFGIESLLPAFYPALASVFEYLPPGVRLVLDDAGAVRAAVERQWNSAEESYRDALRAERPVFPPGDCLLDGEGFFRCLERRPRLELGLAQGEADFRLESRALGEMGPRAREQAGEGGPLEPLLQQVSDWRRRGRRVFLVSSRADRARELQKSLQARGRAVKTVPSLPPPDWRRRAPGPAEPLWLLEGDVSGGFEIDTPAGGEVYLSDEAVFGRRRREEARRSPARPAPSIRPGDLVVHVDFGIGLFEQMVKLAAGGGEGDYLKLVYRGGDLLYLPVTRLNLLDRYRAGGAGGHPPLSRLGGGIWARTKQKVQQSLLEMAGELLRTEAARRLVRAKPRAEAGEEVWNLAASFPWEETPDQHSATEQVLDDLARPVVMDRLLCGDVGFGKTEVAVRAAYFKALQNLQTAVLVPTTVLALQHLNTFRGRLEGRAVRVEMLSRLVPRARQKEILAELAAGRVDVVIGTHRLLQADVSFARLGLLVIDEEQRFGVRHKERLKSLKKEVDVLAMTATPLPRTLHMALSGLRRVSVIQTPPPGRHGIRTVVTRFSPRVVAGAIREELRRGGQVFLLHNWVKSLAAMESFVRRIVPEARTGIAHGQMSERALEAAMRGFIERKIDVLVCTSIIESGLDIPSANTIIINRADMFGLSQLHQIRGRVGRAQERAFAYLLTPGPESLTEDARQRLAVLLQHSQPGAGYQVAYEDMEMRGAGNLLGRAQSGHIAAVGFDLYSRLLEKAIAEVRGQMPSDAPDPEMLLPLTGFLPEHYLPQIEQRLDFYGRLARAEDAAELAEMAREMEDRFGPLPPEADSLCRLMELKLELRRLKARKLEMRDGRLEISLDEGTPLAVDRLAGLAALPGGGWRLEPAGKIVWQPDAVLVREPLLAARAMLDQLLA